MSAKIPGRPVPSIVASGNTLLTFSLHSKCAYKLFGVSFFTLFPQDLLILLFVKIHDLN